MRHKKRLFCPWLCFFLILILLRFWAFVIHAPILKAGGFALCFSIMCPFYFFIRKILLSYRFARSYGSINQQELKWFNTAALIHHRSTACSSRSMLHSRAPSHAPPGPGRRLTCGLPWTCQQASPVCTPDCLLSAQAFLESWPCEPPIKQRFLTYFRPRVDN
jgi:hypothetical protein